jgi:hypothetical protein
MFILDEQYKKMQTLKHGCTVVENPGRGLFWQILGRALLRI